MMNPVSQWSCREVHQFLCKNGFEKYATLLAAEHKIDGCSLLLLTEDDLRKQPLAIVCLGDIKKLGQAIQQLKITSQFERDPAQNIHENHHLNNTDLLLSEDSSCRLQASRSAPVVVSPTFISFTDGLSNITAEDLCRHIESPDTPRKSFMKTLVAFLYCSIALFITCLVMVIVHDRVPDMKTYPPLPDIVLDNIPLIPWAFQCCEYLAVVMSVIWFCILIFHKHKVIIFRRMFSLVGTVFLLRSITMVITSMSVPGVHLDCRAQAYGDIWAKLRQAFYIWSGLGMSIQGVRTCGDYMFSGHTTAVTLLNHFITEYTPESWTQLHTATWVMNLFAVFFILAAHEHYSIDVFIAFYISSRLFCYYHAMAQLIVSSTDKRTRAWFPFMWFFESGNPGRVPNEFEWPFPSGRAIDNMFKHTAKFVATLFGRGAEASERKTPPKFSKKVEQNGNASNQRASLKRTKNNQNQNGSANTKKNIHQD